MQDTILKVGGLVAAIGPLLIVAGSALRAVASLIKIMGVAGKAFLVLSRILLTNPFILVAAAIIALVVVVVKNWDKISRVIAAGWNFVKNITARVWGAVSGFIRNVWNNIAGFIGSAISNVRNTIQSGLLSVNRWIVDRWNGIVSFFRGLPRRIGNAVRGMWDGIKNGFRSAINAVINWWNNLSFSLPSVDTVFGSIGGFTLNTPNIPRLHDGGVFEPAFGSEGLALLRRGELVIPPEMLTRPDVLDPSGMNVAAPRVAVPAGQSNEILIRGDGTARADFVLEELRAAIQRRGGGDVQLVLGGRR